MESKKLPVLYVPYDTDALTDKESLELTRTCVTPFRGSFMKQEPYIPVARVREMIASIKVAAKDMSHPSMNRDCWLCGMVHLQKLIEDVDMGVLRDEG